MKFWQEKDDNFLRLLTLLAYLPSKSLNCCLWFCDINRKQEKFSVCPQGGKGLLYDGRKRNDIEEKSQSNSSLPFVSSNQPPVAQEHSSAQLCSKLCLPDCY